MEIFLLSMILVLILFGFYKLPTKTFLGSPKQFQSDEDVTTLLPIPILAATCIHDWEIISEKVLEMPHEKKCVIILNCRRCGSIDKTIQTTSVMPEIIPEPCKHDWQSTLQENLEVPHEQKIVAVMTCRNCGAIDKTIEVTSKSPLQCNHVWETEKKVILDSAYEQMIKSISEKQPSGRKDKISKDKEIDLDLNSAPNWMFKKTYVCVHVCKKCGEINKTIASNFEAEEVLDASINN